VNFFRDQSVLRSQIISVYSDILKLVWQVAIGIAGLGFFLVFFEKEVKLRTKLETEFGMKQKNERRQTMLNQVKRRATRRRTSIECLEINLVIS